MKPLTLSVVICKATIVRTNVDYVAFEIATHDQYGTELPYSNLHGDYEEFNSRTLKIETPVGQGPDLIRKLGWGGEIVLIIPKCGPENSEFFIEAWDFDNQIKVKK